MLNIDPKEREKPRVRSQVPELQATGNADGLTKRPSRPENEKKKRRGREKINERKSIGTYSLF